jgi:hypothetical protein
MPCVERRRPLASARVAGWARLVLAGLVGCLLPACGGSPTDSGISGGLPGGDHPSFEDLFGPALVSADGSQVGLRAVQDKALVGIYFADPSCPACAAFTPLLVSTYDELMTAGKSFEIVLVSVGGGSADMFAFMQRYGMGWPAVPYDPSRLLALLQRFGVQWVPTLVVIDSDRDVVTKTGREDVLAAGAGAFDVWLATRPAP